MTWSAGVLLVIASALISSGVFLYSVPLGLIVSGCLLAALTVLMVVDFGDARETSATPHQRA